MKIKPISKRERNFALDFIAPYENECVNLANEILGGSQNCYALLCEEKIVGAFCFRNRRTIFHCLPFTKYKTALDKILCQETQSSLYEFFADEKTFCINGEATGSLFLKNIFRYKKNPAHARIMNEYFLMRKNPVQEKNVVFPELPRSSESGFRIFQATPYDEEKIFPLEFAYQIEEVIPPDFAFSEKALRESFKLNLQIQRIFVLESDGAPIAKAAIAADGKKFALLGGIYTLPEFRRKGFAATLIRNILRRLAEENKSASLYVKKKNSAAAELYKKLGFEQCGEYRLIYF